MNELKLSLDNFQSISKGELEFKTGINLIVGQTNSGKSATFRALKTCLSNTSGSQTYIKNGTKQATVTLDYNGNVIQWDRTPKESKYVINGETYIKTGNSNAFKILGSTDTGFIRDINDLIMNIEEELQLPFPFGMSGSELFRLYEDVFCISDSSIILKSAKGHEEDTKGQINSLKESIVKDTIKLEELQKFKNELDLKILRDYHDTLTDKSDRIKNLSEGLDLIKTALRIHNNPLKVELLNFENKTVLYKELGNTKSVLNVTKSCHSLSKSLKELAAPPTSKFDQYKECVTIQNTIKNLKSLENVEIPISAFNNHILKYNELKEYKQDLKGIIDKIKQSKDKLTNANNRVEQLQERLAEYKVCPLCHNVLDITNKEN